MNILFNAILFLLGSLLGSFFYTLALRYVNQSIKLAPIKALFSRSHCPSCNKTVKPYDLIPIVSYIILKARCRQCETRIPIAYPLFELLFGLLALVIVKFLNIQPATINIFQTLYLSNIFFLTSIFIVIIVVDLKTMTIPNSLIIVAIVFSLFPIILTPPYLDHLYGMLLMLLTFSIVMFIFPGGFGGGDLKLAPVIGLLLGLQPAIIALETALISGALIGIIYGIYSGRGIRIKIPFAPFLCLGLLVAALLGDEIMLYYYKLFY